MRITPEVCKERGIYPLNVVYQDMRIVDRCVWVDDETNEYAVRVGPYEASSTLVLLAHKIHVDWKEKQVIVDLGQGKDQEQTHPLPSEPANHD